MNYIGIDLGTTNSAICSFDGESVRTYKSPEQHDVTPSAIYVDKRGNRRVGANAYSQAARNPDSAATLFKRFMGTGTPIKLPAVNLTMTPEECSSEILGTLFGYLPDEITSAGVEGTVITVPAAFNQMQKDATLNAAEAAGIGKVALMQEPVAAVMSVMRTRSSDGVFAVFDIGGGTLDVAVAESTSGRVSLLGHGGIAMCGGRDFDRAVFTSIIKPWLHENFSLPDDFIGKPEYQVLVRMATWAGERGKIELSQRDDVVISISESEVGARDESGEEIYIDVTLSRARFNQLIDEELAKAINAARETIEHAGVTADGIDRIVFVGGPSHYGPLRERVAFELGIAASTDVNPMTAVAEGAAVFAESIDWSSEKRGRKSGRGNLEGGLANVSFTFTARTPDTKAKIALKAPKGASGSVQFDSIDSGWSSGKIPLKDGSIIELPLAKSGENVFKVFVSDDTGKLVSLPNDRIVISRVAATVDAIPASHSVGIEVRGRVGGATKLSYLVKAGEHLPKEGKRVFKAEESLKSGSIGSLKFKLWEGEIETRVHDNRYIGIFEIRGSELPTGAVIPAGAELEVSYQVADSGAISIDVAVPAVGGSFSSHRNFYSWQEVAIDYTAASQLIKSEADAVRERLQEIAEKVDDPEVDEALARLESTSGQASQASDGESAKKALDEIQEVKKLVEKVRKDNLEAIRQMELNRVVARFDSLAREHARPAEVNVFESLVKTAERKVNDLGGDFEVHLSELWGKIYTILWRQSWYVADWFKWLADSPHRFADAAEHARFVAAGEEAIRADDIDQLRRVVVSMNAARIDSGGDDDMSAIANIIG